MTAKQPPKEPGAVSPPESGFWTDRRLATALAVLLHGFSNLAANAIPPRVETVLEAAEKIEAHLQKK